MAALIVYPVVLAALALAAAAFDAILAAGPATRFRTAGARGARRERAPGGASEGRVAWAAAAPLREVARLLVQQRRRTVLPDLVLLRAGVWSLPAAAVLAGAVLPLGERPVVESAVGVVWFNAMEVCVWGALWLTGWAPNSVFPLVGGYRFVAQGLAYELPHMFALITAALGAGSLGMTEIAGAQRGLWFVVWMPVAFAIYLVSALAMAFWGPFGQPVGGDLAGGVRAELSGPDRLIFQAGRYAILVVASAAAVPLFLGGGAGPLLPSWAWTLVKTVAVLGLLVWAGRRLPAVRMDRFTQASWLVLIPAALLQMLVVGMVVM